MLDVTPVLSDSNLTVMLRTVTSPANKREKINDEQTLKNPESNREEQFEVLRKCTLFYPDPLRLRS